MAYTNNLNSPRVRIETVELVRQGLNYWVKQQDILNSATTLSDYDFNVNQNVVLMAD